MSESQLYPCEDCMSLVGAERFVPAHDHLRAFLGPRGRAQMTCEQCGALWIRHQLGWVRGEDGTVAQRESLSLAKTRRF